MALTYYVVTRTEYCGGPDCEGHDATYVVACHSPEDARAMVPKWFDWDDEVTVRPMALPDLPTEEAVHCDVVVSE